MTIEILLCFRLKSRKNEKLKRAKKKRLRLNHILISPSSQQQSQNSIASSKLSYLICMDPSNESKSFIEPKYDHCP